MAASDTESLLASLVGVPASLYADALGAAGRAVAPLQAREKQQAEASFPTIDQPTGMPAVPAPHAAAPTALAPGAVKGAPAASAVPTPQPAPTAVAKGPVPGSQVSTAASEPAAKEDDGGGSWWSWLVDRLHNFFGSLPTSDPNVSTSAGERQRLQLAGDADPAQNDREVEASGASVDAGHAHADQATQADFGENAVAPTLPRSKMRPAYRPTPPKPGSRARAPAPPALPADEKARLDAQMAPMLDAQTAAQGASYRREKATYEQASKQAQEEGARQIADENERTRADQVALRKAAQADVSGARLQWQQENRKIQADFGDKAGARRQEVDREIGQKVETTHRDADAAFDAAEKQAETEKTRSEAEAAAKKKAEEDKPRSWWDRVKGAVSDAFDAIRGAITAIFDKLREVVKGIIDAAKKAVHVLIEAARSAIVGLIQTFGTFLKGLVSIALAAFPEAAAKARAWIDDRVNAATDAVNRAAKTLEKAADAILDAVGKAIDAALDIMQAALNAALDVMEKLALLPFQAMEALAKLVEWVAKNGKFVLAALRLEVDGDAVIAALKGALGGMIADVPGQAYAKLQQFTAVMGGDAKVAAPAPKGNAVAPAGMRVQRSPDASAAPAQRHVPVSVHVSGILRHLGEGLSYLKDHWWDELKKVGWNLLWPWPAVWGDMKALWAEVKLGFSDAYHGHFSTAIDHLLAADQKFNSILGNLYGWFFIASVLVGAVIGAFFGGAGAIPGALAGAAFAGEVGEALVAGLIATESAVIVKGVADLMIGNDTATADEEDYKKIGGSTLTIGVTLAMMLIGEIAAKLAQSIWEAVAGIFKGEKAPEVKVEVDEPGGKSGDSTDAKGDAPEVIDGERVVAKEPTGDGHEVKVTEEGRCLVCSTCEEIGIRYKEQLEAGTPESDAVRAELEKVREMPNGDAKAEALAEIEKKLEALKSKEGTPAAPKSGLEVRMEALDQAAKDAAGALESLKREKLRSPEVDDLRIDPATKKELARLEAEVDALGRERASLQSEIEKKLKAGRDPDIAADPDLAKIAAEDAEKLQQALDDIKKKADDIDRQIDDKLRERAAEKQRLEEARAKATAEANDAKQTLDNICDETDGTNRPDATVGDGSTEAVLREEIEQGRPIKSPEGHHIKASESISGLERALEELKQARPQIDDPILGKALDDTAQRAADRLAKLQEALREWNERGQSHPDQFNPDGSSKVTPGWP